MKKTKSRYKKGGYYSLLFFHQGRREFAIFRLDEIRDDQILEGPVLTERNGVVPSVNDLTEKPFTSQTRFLKPDVQHQENKTRKFFCQGILSECDPVIREVWKNGFKEMNPKHTLAIDSF